MARRNVIVCFLQTYILTYMWICSRAFVHEVNCWYNQALPIGDNVSVLCHTSFQGRPPVCGLCQLDVMISEQRHQLPSACADISQPFAVSFASEHRGHIHCMLKCPSNTTHICNVTVSGGYLPYPPSQPQCSVEDPEKEDIHCFWSKSYRTMIPTTDTLHWQNEDGNIISRESEMEHGIITRPDYNKNSLIKVWVTSRNVLGSAKSQESVFNTGHITRPDPPIITNHISEPLEIFWTMQCDILDSSGMNCQVQYHAVDDIDWTEVDDFQVMFQLEEPLPFTVYQFRVRCLCGHEEKVMSHWSSVYSVRTPPAAPVGKLDVWSDCAPNSDTSLCNIFWKEMPISQARGEVSNYIVTLKLENGTESQQVIMQQRDTETQCSAQDGYERLWRFQLLQCVKGVSVSANTSMGMSEPTFMALPVLGQSTASVNLSVIGLNQKLVVSWSAPSGFSENIQEYVVQHVSVEPPHTLCLDWLRVNKTQSSVTLTGEFRNFTAYNVSLFAVISNSSTFLRSALAYTLQGVPPEVPQFHVKNISHSSVTLTWSHIPVHESKGVILQYSLGVNEASVVNVSSDRTSYQMSELQPAQQYQVWVSAMTAAGEGARSISTFSTEEKPGYITSALLAVYIVLPIIALPIILFLILRSPVATLCCGAVPDPTNSKTFKHANNQYVWPGLCSPSEPLKISQLEIVENLITVAVTPPSEIKREDGLLDTEQDQIPDGVQRKVRDMERIEESVEPKRETISKDYSEMVDTDEDEGGDEEDEDEDWDEQHCVSDYERHFMPSV